MVGDRAHLVYWNSMQNPCIGYHSRVLVLPCCFVGSLCALLALCWASIGAAIFFVEIILSRSLDVELGGSERLGLDHCCIGCSYKDL